MSEVLYRKYRPEVWADVIGQDHIVEVLKESIKEGNISHAYLLTGGRGIGKTTIARIIAKELGTDATDIIELDAASNNGVDEIRAINEAVHTLPFNSKYKVYILDEVHMLSKGAFNALLKTLEEPPKHVIFILATTELNKVPETIISRCQVYTFKKPTENILKETVSGIVKKEKLKISDQAAELIAILGDGSFRDTFGILQKVISAGNEKIEIEDVEKLTGAPQDKLVNDFTLSVMDGNVEDGMKVLEIATNQNLDTTIFTKLVIIKFRAHLLARALKVKDELAHKHLNSTTLTYLLDAYSQTKEAVVPTLPLELVLIRVGEEK